MHGLDWTAHWSFQMTFHTGFCETVLFDSWKVSSVGGLVGSMIGICIMAALYEGLKYYRYVVSCSYDLISVLKTATYFKTTQQNPVAVDS
jgi:Ctr copper transporter family.